MQLNTKYFGTISCSEDSFLHFPNGLFGFEDETEFVLLPFDGSQGTLLCFQSKSTPELAFVAVNPFSLDPTYRPTLMQEELTQLGVTQNEALSFYALCVVKDPVGTSTVNLRCPIAVNEDTHQAIQVILETNQYHMHHLLSEFGRKGESCLC